MLEMPEMFKKSKILSRSHQAADLCCISRRSRGRHGGRRRSGSRASDACSVTATVYVNTKPKLDVCVNQVYGKLSVEINMGVKVEAQCDKAFSVGIGTDHHQRPSKLGDLIAAARRQHID